MGLLLSQLNSYKPNPRRLYEPPPGSPARAQYDRLKAGGYETEPASALMPRNTAASFPRAANGGVLRGSVRDEDFHLLPKSVQDRSLSPVENRNWKEFGSREAGFAGSVSALTPSNTAASFPHADDGAIVRNFHPGSPRDYDFAMLPFDVRNRSRSMDEEEARQKLMAPPVSRPLPTTGSQTIARSLFMTGSQPPTPVGYASGHAKQAASLPAAPSTKPRPILPNSGGAHSNPLSYPSGFPVGGGRSIPVSNGYSQLGIRPPGQLIAGAPAQRVDSSVWGPGGRSYNTNVATRPLTPPPSAPVAPAAPPAPTGLDLHRNLTASNSRYQDGRVLPGTETRVSVAPTGRISLIGNRAQQNIEGLGVQNYAQLRPELQRNLVDQGAAAAAAQRLAATPVSQQTMAQLISYADASRRAMDKIVAAQRTREALEQFRRDNRVMANQRRYGLGNDLPAVAAARARTRDVLRQMGQSMNAGGQTPITPNMGIPEFQAASRAALGSAVVTGLGSTAEDLQAKNDPAFRSWMFQKMRDPATWNTMSNKDKDQLMQVFRVEAQRRNLQPSEYDPFLSSLLSAPDLDTVYQQHIAPKPAAPQPPRSIWNYPKY